MGDQTVYEEQGLVGQTALPLDPQVGWEQQKFFIAWTLLFLPENQQQHWLQMFNIWALGSDADPEFENRIEFHDPMGQIYVAKRFGTEEIFGKVVEKGISARVLQYANELLVEAYETTDGPDRDDDGTPDWYIPVINPETGLPSVKFDSGIAAITEDGFVAPGGKEGCSPEDSSECTCNANRACTTLSEYVEVPFYLHESMNAYRLGYPGMKGVW